MGEAQRHSGNSGGLVVFAHTPPPHHGQSAMVGLMLGALAEGFSRRVFHVNARVSETLADVGGMRPWKLVRLAVHCMAALWYRVRWGAKALYFVPAPPKRSALLRDLAVLAALRPFFPGLILHWHAVGLGAWVEGRGAPIFAARESLIERGARGLARRLLGGAACAVVIADGNASDAAVFAPRRVEVVPNGLPEPCLDFAAHVGGRRRQTALARERVAGRGGRGSIRVLFLSHCTAEKGLFTAISGIGQAAAARPGLRWIFEVAGDFVDAAERERAREEFVRLEAAGVEVVERGFLAAASKAERFAMCDVFVFPSRTESFGLVAVEALAWGVPVVASDIPGLRAVLGPLPCPRIPVDDAGALGRALVTPSTYVEPDPLRARYEAEFTVARFAERIRRALA